MLKRLAFLASLIVCSTAALASNAPLNCKAGDLQFTVRSEGSSYRIQGSFSASLFKKRSFSYLVRLEESTGERDFYSDEKKIDLTIAGKGIKNTDPVGTLRIDFEDGTLKRNVTCQEL